MPQESGSAFDVVVRKHALPRLVREQTTTLQINVGKLCNQACHHCHVEAGPRRTEIMTPPVVDRLLELLQSSPGIETVDITGGAPELNPQFRRLVLEARRMHRNIIDRCNLTVFFEDGQEDLPEFLASHRIEIIASLPCYTADNVDRQRGHGVFEKSVDALQRLNRLGYGRRESGLDLHLVYNPLGASLPPPQQALEADYKTQLSEHFGIEFNRLFTITNMPIKRFADFLYLSGNYESYMGLLVNHFNPATVERLMCRSLVSVGWDGRLYDCDFNQMLELGMLHARNVWDISSFENWKEKPIATGQHCFGCTAGAGSSCGGTIA